MGELFFEFEAIRTPRCPAQAAAAEGVIPPSKEDFEKAKSDPEAAQRVEKFQKWYSGACDDSDSEDFEDEGFDDLLEFGVPRCCGAFTPSTRVDSGRAGLGWSFFRFRGRSDRFQ